LLILVHFAKATHFRSEEARLAAKRRNIFSLVAIGYIRKIFRSCSANIVSAAEIRVALAKWRGRIVGLVRWFAKPV
jgi:hypothetical protein